MDFQEAEFRPPWRGRGRGDRRGRGRWVRGRGTLGDYLQLPRQDQERGAECPQELESDGNENSGRRTRNTFRRSYRGRGGWGRGTREDTHSVSVDNWRTEHQERGAECWQESDGVDGNSGRRTRNTFRRGYRGRGGWGRGAREDTHSVSVDNWRTEARGQYHHGRRGPRGLRQDRGTGGRPRRIDLLCTTPLRQTNIQELSSLDFAVLVRRIDSQLKEFQRAIGDRAIVDSPETMDAIVKILTKLATIAGNKRDAEEQSTASKIMAEILSERSEQFHFQLNRVVKGCMRISQMEQFYELFSATLKTFPSLAWECLPIDELHETAKRAGVTNSKLLKDTNELCKIRDLIREAHSNVPASSDDERDDSAFRLIPILPEWKEICRDNGIPPEVRPNKVKEGYKDWIQYYDIQFRLIREDFIAPLRRGVTAFLDGTRGKKNRDVKIYSRAKITNQVTTKDRGICFVVDFDASGFRRVNYNWDHSKRLIFGSLLCFIPTGNMSVNKIVFATVTDRNSSALMGGEFMVQFEGDILTAMIHCSRQTEFEIVESNSYFEATRPILRSIQKAEVETMPFTRQLIEGECDTVEPPAYLCAQDIPPEYNLSCLHGSMRQRRPPLMIDVLNETSWDAANNTELDASQLRAIRAALTKEISVIQGPPGTGKTYIGLKIVEGLLDNRAIWDPEHSSPILVMCYTNHALDQFLEGIIDNESCQRDPEVIRVGGQSKNDKVKAHNLKNVRRNAWHQFSDEIGELRGELESCNPELIWRELNGYRHNTLLPMYIVRYVAHPYHVYQFSLMAKCSAHIDKELEVWLDLWEEIIIYSNGKGKEGDHLTDSKVEGKANHISDSERKQKEVNYFTDSQGEAKYSPPQAFSGSENDSHQNNAQEGTEQEKEEVDEGEELIELEGEATLAQKERMDDDDVAGYQQVQLPNMGPQETESNPLSRHYRSYNSYYEDGVQDDELNPNYYLEWFRKRDADEIIKAHLFRDSMDDEEASELENTNISSLDVKDRWRLYNYWANRRYKYLDETNLEQVIEYSEKCKQLAELRQREDRYVLESADVIGMTTTGAAKYQHILHTIKPKIVIVEEAAEVLEAHVVSALNAGTQHLILIGDHKQLRPKPNEYILATKYNLSVSLFERLIRNKLSCATLDIQHRMRPEIAQLVCPHVYDHLINHESVEIYPDVRGISRNLFFIHHTEPETENSNLLSYQNEFEVNYIVGLCAHLLKLGYSAGQITILTPYVGQLLQLRSKMPRERFEGVRVTAIDNFQGEENDIILFSMVRSTNPNSSKPTIGFLKEDNRVCVSLSRAKHGFYAIGNFQLIRQQSVLWESIIADVESRGCFGDALPLYCCNHPNTKYTAKKDSDFSINAQNGGCQKECDIRLHCGHSCTRRCHVTDKEHMKFKCRKPCNQLLLCGHQCTRLCYEYCGKCIVKIEKEIPNCGHKQMVPCSESPLYFKCQALCDKLCKNDLHACPKKCSEPCVEECEEYVLKTFLVCGHKKSMKCYEEPALTKCKAICEKLCPNELHSLKKKCCEEWPICNEIASKIHPICGHQLYAPCFINPSEILCKHHCERLCERGHRCPKVCHENCPPCSSKVRETLICGHTHVIWCSVACAKTFKCTTRCSKVHCERGHKCKQKCHHLHSPEPCLESVTILMPNCSHEQSVPCHVSVNPQEYRYTCKRPCEKTLKCGHICKNKCGEECETLCSEKVTTELTCGHRIKVECHMTYQKEKTDCKKQVSVKLACGHIIKTECWKEKHSSIREEGCKERCNKTLECGHSCQEICSKSCTEQCKKRIKKLLPCGHKLECECFQIKERELDPCTKKCHKKLSCGHSCQKSCGEPCSCPLKSNRLYPCRHSSKIPCSSTIDMYPCKKPCQVILSCGHRCSGKCGNCYLSRIHTVCIFDTQIFRYCGHLETVPCAGLSDVCEKKHFFPCVHSQDHTNCHEMCRWECKHFQCRKECREECERPPCNEPCDQELACGHLCYGICGESCLSVCPQCNKEKFMEQFYPKKKQATLKVNPPFFELPCGHIFTVQYLDEHMEASNKTVMSKQCPKCKKLIVVGNHRYGNVVRKAMAEVENIDNLKEEYMLTPVPTIKGREFHGGQPVKSDVRCLIHCVNSRVTLSYCLKSHTGAHSEVSTIVTQLKNLVRTLLTSSKRTQIPAAMFSHFRAASDSTCISLQLLDDYKSELYRLALHAQCIIARSKSEDNDKVGPKNAVATVEQYIDSLDPLKGRISEEEYEHYFNEIASAIPSVAEIHVETPQAPVLTKGNWIKCMAGHYYCVPLVCGSGAEPVSKCTVCFPTLLASKTL